MNEFESRVSGILYAFNPREITYSNRWQSSYDDYAIIIITYSDKDELEVYLKKEKIYTDAVFSALCDYLSMN